MSRAPAKPVPMCCVTIRYLDILLPADKGMKLVELLTHAVECDDSYGDGGYVYTPKQEQIDVSYRAVKPSQVRMAPPQDPDDDSRGPLRALPAPVRRLR